MSTSQPRSSRSEPCSPTRPASRTCVPAATRTSPRAWATWSWCPAPHPSCAVTGTTPHQWLLSQRILLAQRLLETTDEPVERVAQRAGFGSAAGLRQHFSRAVSASPLAYRRTFRSGAVPPEDPPDVHTHVLLSLTKESAR